MVTLNKLVNTNWSCDNCGDDELELFEIETENFRFRNCEECLEKKLSKNRRK